MKRIALIFLTFSVLLSCDSVKRNQQFITQGNYDTAINLAVKKLQKEKTSDKAQDHIVLLEDAFRKAVEKDKNEISFLKKSKSSEAIRNIYYLYLGLKERQYKVVPLLPLKIKSHNGKAKFNIVNYDHKIISAKNKYAEYLYDVGSLYFNRNTKNDYRNAYTVFCELSEIKPNFKDAQNLLDESQFRGINFVIVKLLNRSNKIIPINLERDLLNFNTSGLEDQWTLYHNQVQKDINYDFGVDLVFRTIDFSPERVSEKSLKRSKRVKTGWKYKKDRNGNIVNDENGKPIKIDTYTTVIATVNRTIQSKSVLITGVFSLRDFNQKREINNFPLSSEFIFENVFIKYRGDKRALTNEDLEFLNNKFVRFPRNEQMFYDAGDDIKFQLFEILKKNSFR